MILLWLIVGINSMDNFIINVVFTYFLDSNLVTIDQLTGAIISNAIMSPLLHRCCSLSSRWNIGFHRKVKKKKKKIVLISLTAYLLPLSPLAPDTQMMIRRILDEVSRIRRGPCSQCLTVYLLQNDIRSWTSFGLLLFSRFPSNSSFVTRVTELLITDPPSDPTSLDFSIYD